MSAVRAEANRSHDSFQANRPGKLRVLIVAPNASTRFGGESILAVNYFRILNELGHEAWLVTHERTRGHLEIDLPHLTDRVHFTPDRWTHRLIHRSLARAPGRSTAAISFHSLSMITGREQRRVARDLVRSLGIDIVHQPAPVSPRAVSWSYGLGAPVVIGPLNGNMSYPTFFRAKQNSLDRLGFRAGRIIFDIMNRLVPGKRRAAKVLVANERTREGLPSGVRADRRIVVENAVDFDIWKPTDRDEGSTDSKRRFVYLGRLVDWKMIDIALSAYASRAAHLASSLLIIGDGPERSRLERLGDELGIRERIEFTGFVPQDRCPALLAGATALILPSIYECGGAVVLEAMAMGVPVIATRWGGPSDYLDDSTGVLIEPLSRHQMIEAFGDAMHRIETAPEEAARLANLARQKVMSEFSWKSKVESMVEIYQEAIAQGQD